MGWAGGRGGVVLGTPEVGSGSHPGPGVLGQDHRLQPGGAPRGARGSLTRPDSTRVGQHDQGVALLLPDQAPEVAHGLRQGALGRNELGNSRDPGGRQAGQGPLPQPLPSGSRAQADPSLTGMKLALMYSEARLSGRARRGTRDQSSTGDAGISEAGERERGKAGTGGHGELGWGRGPRRGGSRPRGLPAHGGRSFVSRAGDEGVRRRRRREGRRRETLGSAFL